MREDPGMILRTHTEEDKDGGLLVIPGLGKTEAGGPLGLQPALPD